MKFRLKWKVIRIILLLTIVLSLIFVFAADMIISQRSKSYLYTDVDSIPENKTGLVLGTTKYVRKGLNPFFKNRIDATLELYHAGKIHFVVVSGDNSRHSYNEPLDMKNDLIAGGVPDSVIYLDYAGFRTLDSVVRMNKIFGQKRFTVISQKFHNERAIFIAQQYDLEVCGYNAKDVSKRAGFKTMVREKFARVKVFVDMLTGKKPKFLGEEIEIK